ncbi:type II secretion system F family protein [Glycomyces tenuis]|uniref:type II secretion system F family protein n=1 Tax=Glycomyces tenuis TaxID=58116 RepID=UPI00041E9F29|nr:type II secretion system F family protein [Glycomyces tenuis]
MSPLIAGLLGAFAGAAVWAALALAVPAKPDLATALDDLTGPAPGTEPGPAALTGRLIAVLGRLGLVRERIRADLDALDQAPAAYLGRLARLVALSAALPITLGLVLAAAGTAVDPMVIATAAVAFAALTWAVVEADLHTRAGRARAEAARALAVVLSLTAMALSGGAGIDSALRSAAGAGHGVPFERIRAVLDKAALLTRTPWETLGELGERLGVGAYTQLAATTALAGTEGARIRTSLTDRATAMRGQRLADIEADALAATERMSLPIVAMATAFVVIVGYPALERIMTGL